MTKFLMSPATYEWAGRIILALALLTGLLDLLGMFTYADRIDFQQRLMYGKEGEIPPTGDHPAAIAFIERFPPKIPSGKDLSYFQRMGLLAPNGSRPQIGEVWCIFSDGTRSQSLANYAELEAWAKESRLSPWIFWCLAFVGAALTWLADITKWYSSKRRSAKIQNSTSKCQGEREKVPKDTA